MTEQRNARGDRPKTGHIVGGELLNICIGGIVITVLSGRLMDLAARILGEDVAWPQIGFMSAYPDDVRNGYLLFVLAVVATVYLSSGVFAAYAGASIGKAMVGIRYVDAVDGVIKPRRLLLRASLIVLLLLPVLLAGPLLGFVFGPSGDTWSLIALGLSCIVFIWLAIFHHGEQPTWVNRNAGVKPVLRHKAR